VTRFRDIRLTLIDDGANVRSADAGLVASIRAHGILQPVTVRPNGTRFELVIGFRRIAAARELGLETVPAIVESGEADGRILRQLAENTDRRGMRPLAIARALQDHLDDHPGLTKRELAEQLGRHPVWVANKLALLRLEAPVQDLIERGEIGEQAALRSRPSLNDGRGRRPVLSVPDSLGRSRSVTIPIGKGLGTADVGFDAEFGTVELVVMTGGRGGAMASLTSDEARLLGRRLQQAADALAIAMAKASA
jgi:ParB/RepB/Spo0J family partition protein